MKTQKCCAHCPGKTVAPSTNDSHDCCQPKYVSGTLRISSLEKHAPERERTREPSPEASSCYDKFALAKKLHAENLQHQPLPDKVDDSIFRNVRGRRCCPSFLEKCKCADRLHETEQGVKSTARYGPVLGCKKPKTRMDLAICWETPVDPLYEPLRPTHIDGSEGGSAPSIFTLVQRTTNSKAALRSGALEMNVQRTGCRCKGLKAHFENENKEGNKDDVRSAKSCCCESLCDDLSEVKISKEEAGREQPGKRSYRKCAACQTQSTRDDPRLIKSAVGLALGMQKEQNTQARNGLAPRTTIPRPRTPFARRSFCIDTLAPPFSVVKGCRDADYPEHWRLMSVYQQSYKNPQKRKSSYRF